MTSDSTLFPCPFLHRVPLPSCPWGSEYGLLGGTLSALKPVPRRTVLHSGGLASGTQAVMGKVFFSVPVNSVRRARCSCPGRCYLSCRIPPTAALQAPSGLGCARVPGKAAGGAVGSGPSGTGGFLSGPTFQAPGSWKDSIGAPPAPDVSLQPHYTQPGCCAVPGSRLQKLPLLRASQHPGTVPCVGTAEQSTGKARKLSLGRVPVPEAPAPLAPVRELCRRH